MLHQLDLRPTLNNIFRSFHPSCVQRKIKRAERENLAFKEGQSEELLAAFYRLLRITRRRHGVPPQPFEWFLNLIACLGDALKVRVAYKRWAADRGCGDTPLQADHDVQIWLLGARIHSVGWYANLMWSVSKKPRGQHSCI